MKLCAWTYDGLITIDGEKTDAAFAQVSERGGFRSKILAMRYRFNTDGGPESFGGFLVTGEADGWLR